MAYDLDEDLGTDPMTAQAMTETESGPDFPPCPNCGLNGGRCCPVDFYFSEDDDDLARDGFEIECTFCDAATYPTEPTQARALELWNEGRVISAFEQARQELLYRAMARDLGEPPPSVTRSSLRPTRRKPGEEAPEF